MTMPENFNILLIEGRGGIARALLSSQSGFTSIHADRMAKAETLAALARAGGAGNAYSAILIDPNLPDSQGLEAFRRAAASLPGVPVVALWQGSDSAFAEAILSEGAQACLDKDGLDGGALAQALRQAVLRSRAESRRFRALFDSAPIGILLAAGRRVIMANPAALEILGRAEGEFAQQSVLEFFPGPARPILEKALDAGAGDIPETRFSADLIRPGGSLIRCRVFITGAVVNDAPAVALYLASLEEREAGSADESGEGRGLTHREHVRQARKMEALGRLAGGVAHDFNNLLTAINGYSEHLLTLPGSEGAIATGLKAIRRAGETAAAMTRSLMSFSRVEGAEAKPVGVDAAIREMEPMLQRLIGGQIEFLVKLGAGKAAVRMEPGQLEQVVLNLCVNARDAISDGGVLTLVTEAVEVGPSDTFTHLASGQGPHIAITVEDTGTGMGPETLECLFEPFYTTKRGGRGTGLGLATVYGVVSQAGGGISVTSIPGEGSRFRIFLAKDAFEAEAPETPAAEPGWKGQHGRETVLVVEDEPSLREMIVAILSRYGFDLLEAASAAEAMDLVMERPDAVDVVVSDVMLRGEGGHELAESLQAVKPGLRTVFISGHSLESLADRDIIVPADAFLEKPFSPAQLAAKVRAVLDTARKS